MPISHSSNVYDEVNRQWKSTCKILLGGEVGELSDFAEWLYKCNGPRIIEKSGISGKDVVFTPPNYPANSARMSLDEVDFAKKGDVLSINEIKDIDSIIRAVSDKIAYTGNIHLGNSSHIVESTTVVDSHFIYHSEQVSHSKYVAYSTHIIGNYVFGSHCCSSDFHIRSNSFMAHRCFEVSLTDYSYDCYFSHGLSSCNDCMFCFNLRSKRNRIGNLELPREKYLEIKKKILSQLNEELTKTGRISSSIFTLNGKNGTKP